MGRLHPCSAWFVKNLSAGNRLYRSYRHFRPLGQEKYLSCKSVRFGTKPLHEP
jgi:hypothetical protein